MKIFLCGFHWVGCRVLEHLLSRKDITEVALFTHDGPDHIESAEQCAKRVGVWSTTTSVNDKSKWPFQPDVISSVYYRDIIRPEVIDAVHGKIFNLHPSLLPRHRGCSSLTWALVEGDPITGTTFHYIDKGVDTGRVILQAAIQVSPTETQATLYQRAMETGADFWPAAFELVKAGFPGVTQQGVPTRHRRGVPNAGQIDDNWSIEVIERYIRAMTYPPYPYATYRGEEVKTLDDYHRIRARGE